MLKSIELEDPIWPTKYYPVLISTALTAVRGPGRLDIRTTPPLPRLLPVLLPTCAQVLLRPAPLPQGAQGASGSAFRRGGPGYPCAPQFPGGFCLAWMLSVNGISIDNEDLQALAQPYTVDRKDAVIGGGCCVHLSVEYFYSAHPSPRDSKLKIEPVAAVLVPVMDSETTFLSWCKTVSPNGYHIKEGIITTKPGAQLYLYGINAVARVRWCEIFSC